MAVDQRQAVLRANSRFYEHFAAGDTQAIDALWAHRESVCCTHPGRPALRGRAAVLESWHAIFSGGAPPVRCREAQAALWGDVALVTCIEDIEGMLLAASNLWVLEGEDWKLAHHHAGHLAAESPPSAGTLH